MPLLTVDDFIDTWVKIKQRGLNFILSKINPNGIARTKSAFNTSALSEANWWVIPEVKKRWNYKITGNEHVNYETYTVEKYLLNKTNLRLLSIGSGECSHEINFAKFNCFKEIICSDLVNHQLQIGKKNASLLGIKNMQFLELNVYKLPNNLGTFDVILFHSSLHHFKQIEQLITNKILPLLNTNGLVIINEYVGANRLQSTKEQLKYINKGLATLPSNLKKRFKSNSVKNSYTGSGKLRVYIADPSECVESETILPILNNTMQCIETKPYGGNILMGLLKDIAHNFNTEHSLPYLKNLFNLEDTYLQNHPSDFVYAVYKKI